MSLSRVELGFFSVALWPALREIPRGLQAQEVSWLSSGQGGLGAGSVEEQKVPECWMGCSSWDGLIHKGPARQQPDPGGMNS